MLPKPKSHVTQKMLISKQMHMLKQIAIRHPWDYLLYFCPATHVIHSFEIKIGIGVWAYTFSSCRNEMRKLNQESSSWLLGDLGEGRRPCHVKKGNFLVLMFVKWPRPVWLQSCGLLCYNSIPFPFTLLIPLISFFLSSPLSPSLSSLFFYNIMKITFLLALLPF